MCLKIIILIIYVLWGILKTIITCFIFQCTEGDPRLVDMGWNIYNYKYK